MDGTVKIPGIGPMPKVQVYALGAGAAAIVAFAYYRARNSAAPTVVDPSVDPAGLIGDPAGGGSFVNPAPSGAVPDPTVQAAPRTNAEWSQRVTEALAFSFDGAMIQTVLGKYLDRQGLTTSEQLLIRTAWAFEGRPPEGTYPIVPATTSTPTTPTTPGGGTTTPKPKPTAAMQTIPRGRSIYDAVKSAHPSASAPQANKIALDSIHYNTDNGVNPWPRGIPGPALTQYKFKANTRVYIL